jgi:hypothetical protein
MAKAACGKDQLSDPACSDVLLLALTPAAYSSNNTAHTPGRRAFISPAQVRQKHHASEVVRGAAAVVLTAGTPPTAAIC